MWKTKGTSASPSHLPKTQISVMSLEKVVPTMEDALHMLRLLCRNCTGQRLSAYISMDSGPKKKGEIDGPEELIIIIVDGGPDQDLPGCEIAGGPAMHPLRGLPEDLPGLAHRSAGTPTASPIPDPWARF